jgi:hypothetical protein
MFLYCKKCRFWFKANPLPKCPICQQWSLASPAGIEQPLRMPKYPALRGQSTTPPLEIDADRFIEECMGRLYRWAQYPLLLGMAGLINAAGSLRDPAVELLKSLKFSVHTQTSLFWAWKPTFEGASRLTFRSRLTDNDGVRSNCDVQDVPLGLTFFVPQHRQTIAYKSVSADKKSGYFGQVSIKALVTDQITGQGSAPLRPANLSGQIEVSSPNFQSRLFDFSSLKVRMDLVQVQYLGDFMRPPTFVTALNLSRYFLLKREMTAQMTVAADDVRLGLNWGRWNLSIPVSATGGVEFVVLDEPVADSDSRTIIRGSAHAKLTKFLGYQVPVWGIFKRSFVFECRKAPSGAKSWTVASVPKQPVPRETDSFQNFLLEQGPC